MNSRNAVREYVLLTWKKCFRGNNEKNIACMREYLRRSGIQVWDDLFDRVTNVGMDGDCLLVLSPIDRTAYAMIFRYVTANTNFLVNDTFPYRKAKTAICDLLKDHVLPVLQGNIKSIFDTTETEPSDVRNSSVTTFLHLMINLLDHVMTPIEKVNHLIANKDEYRDEITPKTIEVLNGNVQEARKYLGILEDTAFPPNVTVTKRRKKATRGNDKEKLETKAKPARSAMRLRSGRKGVQKEQEGVGNVQTAPMKMLLQKNREKERREAGGIKEDEEEEKKKEEEEIVIEKPKRGRGRQKKVLTEPKDGMDKEKEDEKKPTRVVVRRRGRAKKAAAEEEVKPKEDTAVIAPAKRGRGRAKKAAAEEEVKPKEDAVVAEPVKKRRGRPKKTSTEEEVKPKEDAVVAEPVKKKRGRPKKVSTEVEVKPKEDAVGTEPPKKKRGRPKKVYTEEELQKREEEKKRKKEEKKKLREAKSKHHRGKSPLASHPETTESVPDATTPVSMIVEKSETVNDDVSVNTIQMEEPQHTEENVVPTDPAPINATPN